MIFLITTFILSSTYGADSSTFFKSRILGFEIQYPTNWVVEPSNSFDSEIPSEQAEDIVFYNPKLKEINASTFAIAKQFPHEDEKEQYSTKYIEQYIKSNLKTEGFKSVEILVNSKPQIILIYEFWKPGNEKPDSIKQIRAKAYIDCPLVNQAYEFTSMNEYSRTFDDHFPKNGANLATKIFRRESLAALESFKCPDKKFKPTKTKRKK